MIGGGKKPRSARFILYLDSGSACRSSPAAMDYQKIIPNAKGQSAFFQSITRHGVLGKAPGVTSYLLQGLSMFKV
jgi:hypothetical protein